MKLECIKDKIKEAIVLTSKIVGKKLDLPVLSCVLLLAKNNQLKIKATNLEIGVEVIVPAKITKEGSVAVSGDILSNILNNIYNEKNITIELKNKNIEIKTDKNLLTVKSLPVDDFPIIPIIKEGSKFKIKTKKLISGIKAVSYSASFSDIKPEISSVYIYKEGMELIFVSTDSVRLSEKKINIKDDSEFSGVILPIKSANEIIRIFNDDEGDVEVNYNENQISVFNNEKYLTARLINGVFPDYRQIIPKDIKTEVIMLKEEILNSLKITNIFSDKFNRVDILVEKEQNKFSLKSQNADIGENTTKIDAVIEGESVEISFNQKYIIDCFQSINKDSVVFCFSGKNKPLLIKGINDGSFSYLIMPINN